LVVGDDDNAGKHPKTPVAKDGSDSRLLVAVMYDDSGSSARGSHFILL
jgi:hypothetical protein